MTARTPRQWLYLVSGVCCVLVAPGVYFSTVMQFAGEPLRYMYASGELLVGLMFLWMGLRSKERPQEPPKGG